MKKSCKYFLCSLFIFLSCFIFNFALAEQTDINGGVISSSTTWTKEGSPYVIYAPVEGGSDFTVATGTTLTIEAGVIVKVDYGQSIKVLGKLIVSGTSEEEVYFTSLYDDSINGDTDLDDGIILPNNSDWIGIDVGVGGDAEFRYSNIYYSEKAFSYDSGMGLLENVKVENVQYGIFASSSNVDIKNSSFNLLSERLAYAYSSSSLSITNSNITNVEDGIVLSGNCHLVLNNSSIDMLNARLGRVLSLFENSKAELNNLSIKNAHDVVSSFGGSDLIFTNSSVDNISERVLIIFENSKAELNNLTIKNVADVAYIFSDSYVKIKNTNIENVTDQAILGFDGAVLDLEDSVIINIYRNTLMFFGGSSDYGTTTLNISSSTISDGNQIGLYIDDNVVSNIDRVIIKNFSGDGIRLSGNPDVLIIDSEISNNDNGIVSWGSNLEIKNSIILNNKKYGISNLDPDALSVKSINNWWGNENGPFYQADPDASSTPNQVSWNVEYQPWLTSLPGTKPKCCSNVLFIPGLEASRLYKTENSDEKRLWEPELFHDNSELYLDSNGSPINSEIYTKDIIDNAYVPIKGNIYESFISLMDKMKTDGLINDWKAVPYDWRLSIDEVLTNGVESNGKIYYSGELSSTSDPYILSELRQLASSSVTGKVNIIAHSNGGLITKELTDKLGSEASNLIEQIIFVAVPQAGTPAAVGALLHGFQQGLPKDWLPLFISPIESRTLGNNMSSAYNLLPSSQYFNYVIDPVITFDNSNLLSSWREKYGSEINAGIDLYNFLSDQSREILPTKSDLVSLPTLNKNLLDSSNEIHNTTLDNWEVPEGITLTEIAGWGEDTLSGIKYYQGISTKCEITGILYSCLKYSTSSVLEYNPIITSDGDGTVVVPSALWTASSTSVGKYWVNLNNYNIKHPFSAPLGRRHADILEVPNLLTFIENIITQNLNTLPEYISTLTPPDTDIGKQLHFILHSPLSLDLYDGEGNHTGISTTTNELEENIQGSRYITFGEVKYISVPASSNLSLSMQGYEAGSFTLDIEEIQGDTITASTTFAGVPSSTSTIATVNIPNGNLASSSPLVIDKDGDGNIDITLNLKLGETVIPDFSSIEDKSNTKPIRRNRKTSVEYLIESTTTEIKIENKVITEPMTVSSSSENELPQILVEKPKENLTPNKIVLVTKNVKKPIINNKVDNKNIVGKSSNNQNYTASVGSVSFKSKIISIISNIFIYIEKRINNLFYVI